MIRCIKRVSKCLKNSTIRNNWKMSWAEISWLLGRTGGASGGVGEVVRRVVWRGGFSGRIRRVAGCSRGSNNLTITLNISPFSHFSAFFVTWHPPPGRRREQEEQGELEETRFLVETGFLSPSPTTFNNASFWEKLLGNCVLNKFIKISKKRSPSKQKNF